MWYKRNYDANWVSGVCQMTCLYYKVLSDPHRGWLHWVEIGCQIEVDPEPSNNNDYMEQEDSEKAPVQVPEQEQPQEEQEDPPKESFLLFRMIKQEIYQTSGQDSPDSIDIREDQWIKPPSF